MEEAVGRKNVDNDGKGLEMLGKSGVISMWKKLGEIAGNPQVRMGKQISTGLVEKERFILWKTWGKMWKAVLCELALFCRIDVCDDGFYGFRIVCVCFHFFLDLVDGVQHGRVVPSAK